MNIKKTIVPLAGTVLTYLATIPTLAHPVNGTEAWHHHGMGDGGWMAGGWMGGGMGWFGMIMMLVWVIILVVVPLAFLYWLFTRSGHRRKDDRAMQVLREQYARGEIDEDEFEERRSRLERE
ncbi:MAG: SHOCT domain-containing protein [Halobacteria archaeon]|nr:SHOCT domain-containing protein [Halobacteria archaeon]